MVRCIEKKENFSFSLFFNTNSSQERKHGESAKGERGEMTSISSEGISRMLERYHVDGHAERILLGAPSMHVDPIAFIQLLLER